jgi:hypothetical protein
VAEPVGKLCKKPIGAAVLYRVLEPGMRAILAVTVVALNAHRVLGNRDDVLRRAKTHDVAQARERGSDIVRHAHPSADTDVVAHDASILDDGDEPEVVREHVDVIRRRNGNGDLEFSRQVRRTVQRLLVSRRGRSRRFPEENFAVGAGTR